MLSNLRLKSPPHDTWFISDLHWGHNREFIYGPRGFDCVKDHDETLIHRWNEVCGHESTALHLGDICFADPTGKRLEELVRRLNFKTLYLLLGNHTSGQSAIYKALMRASHPWAFDGDSLISEVYPLSWNLGHKTVIFLPQYVDATIDREILALCHYPIIAHYRQGRHSIHLCGHSHGNCEFTSRDKGVGKRLDVSVESFGRPINLVEVRRHLKNRDLGAFDHHGES